MRKLFILCMLALLPFSASAQDIEPQTDASGKYFFADESGRRISGPYTSVRWMENSGVWVVTAGGYTDKGGRLVKGKFGVIDAAGRELIAPQYDFIGEADKNGRFWLNKGGKDLSTVKSIQKTISYQMNAFAQKEKDADKLFEERQRLDDLYSGGKTDIRGIKVYGGKFGYADLSGKIILAPLYTSVANGFSEERAWVNKGKKFGVISSDGEIIVPLKYSYIGDYHYGLAVASRKKSGRYLRGYIDVSGSEATPLLFTAADDFDRGFSAVKGIPYDIPDECYSTELFDSLGGRLAKGYDYKLAFVGMDGKLITEMKYDRAFNQTCGLSACYVGNAGGYVNNRGKEIIPFILRRAYSFEDNHAIVSMAPAAAAVNGRGRHIEAPIGFDASAGSDEECLQGIIDTNGVAITDFVYKTIYAPSDSTYSFKRNDGVAGWLDYEGNRLIDRDFFYAGPFHDGVAAFGIDGKYGYIRKNGEILIDCVYDDIATSFNEGIVAVCSESKWGAVDADGKVVIPIMTDSMEDVIQIRDHIYVKNGYLPLTERDVTIYLIRKANASLHFGIDSVIPETHWDF